MSPDSISDRRERGPLDRVDVRTVGVLIVFVAVVAVGAVALSLGGSSGGSDDGARLGSGLDYVPQGVDGVVQVNGSITDDELVLETLGGGDGGSGTGLLDAAWWLIDDGEAPSVDALLSIVGGDNISYETTTAFFGSRNQTAYAGAVVEVENNSSAVVDLVESEVGNLSETEYNGTTVQEISAAQAARQADAAEQYDLTGLLTQFVGNDTKVWVATLNDGTAVLGSAAAVRDVIDIQQGAKPGLSPDSQLRTAHERLEPGQIELTVNTTLFPEDASLSDLAFVIDRNIGAGLQAIASQGESVELLSGSYTPRDEDADIATLNAQATVSSKGGAQSLIDLFKLRYGAGALGQVNATPEAIQTQLPSKRASVSRTGKYVDIEIPEMPDRVVGYVADIVNQYATQFVDRTTTDLVPQAADAATVEQVDPQAESLSVSNATAFGSGDYTGTVVELDSQQALLDAVNRTGSSLTLSESHRETAVYDVPDDGRTVLAGLSGSATNAGALAPVGGRFVVFGTQQAVEDSIDIYRGVAAPHGGL